MRVFVTGASGHIGSAVVPELVGAGHEVTGLARSEASADAVARLGARPHRGDLSDLDALSAAASAADGVIHLAFDHRLLFSGDVAAATAVDLAAVRALGAALAGTGKAFVGTSGTLTLTALALDRAGTEDDMVPTGPRSAAEQEVIKLAGQGVRSSVVRIPPITHSQLDQTGFLRTLIASAKETGVSGYPGDGTNRLPAVHTLDAARLFRLALENAPGGSTLHAVAEEAVPVREIAQHVGDRLGLPAAGIPDDQVNGHFGAIASMIRFDNPTANQATRRLLGWQPVHPGVLADLVSTAYLGPALQVD